MSAVFILGPHRSGTSCIAGALKAMGLYLGPDHGLGDAQPDNPKGFFENLQMLSVNDEILQRFGGNWCTVPKFSSGWHMAHTFADLKASSARILEDNFRGHSTWGFKDPRSCLTFPFWRSIIRGPIKCILMIRNPLEAANSLIKRNGMPAPVGADLWLAYTHGAFASSRGLPRKLVFFDKLVENPREELSETASFLGMSTHAAALDAGTAWVERDLKHQNSSPHEVKNSPDIPERVKKAWTAVRLFSHMENKGEAVRKDEDLLLGVLSRA